MGRQRTRTRGHHQTSRCPTCSRSVKWLKSPFSSSWRCFEPTPVSPNAGAVAYPVEALRAWKFDELVEELMARRNQSRTDAQDEAYAFPWYALHHCPNEPTQDGGSQ